MILTPYVIIFVELGVYPFVSKELFHIIPFLHQLCCLIDSSLGK
jgi:hypothetical protein